MTTDKKSTNCRLSFFQRTVHFEKFGEFRDRITRSGAAKTLPSGEALGAQAISFPKINLPEGGIEHFGGLVVHVACNVSAKLGRI